MGKNLQRTRKQLRVLATEWLFQTLEFVSGPILRVRSGRLRGSLHIIDNTEDDPPTIGIAADAVSDKGFPYAAWHEFESGRSYIRPSLLYLLGKRGWTESGMSRAMVADVEEGIIEDLIQRGWAPDILPNTAVRTVSIDISGRGTTGHLRRGFTKRAIPSRVIRNPASGRFERKLL